MTDLVRDIPAGDEPRAAKLPVILEGNARTRKRNAAEKRFRAYGVIAIFIAILFLAAMLVSIFTKGVGAFTTTEVGLDVTFSEAVIDPSGDRDPAELGRANYRQLLVSALADEFPAVTERRERSQLFRVLSSGAAFQLQNMVLDNPELIGTTQRIWVPAEGDVNFYITRGEMPNAENPDMRMVGWIESLRDDGQIRQAFNHRFFTKGASSEPELAGILGALIGSFYCLLVCFAISFPLGVGAAVYLEEFAKKNKVTDFIEVNINNLAAVPSIVFGLLGLAMFLNVFNLPRSSPLVGGMVLALMTLPTIIIAARASLRAVPPSIRLAAQGLGASKVQTTFHHTVPLAMPGILTGTIIGMAQALGETAPLLMIGMVAFVVDVPSGVMDVASSLPVQIFLWASESERGFEEMTSATIIVLLLFLVLMNLSAVYLRRKLERRF